MRSTVLGENEMADCIMIPWSYLVYRGHRLFIIRRSFGFVCSTAKTYKNSDLVLSLVNVQMKHRLSAISIIIKSQCVIDV